LAGVEFTHLLHNKFRLLQVPIPAINVWFDIDFGYLWLCPIKMFSKDTKWGYEDFRFNKLQLEKTTNLSNLKQTEAATTMKEGALPPVASSSGDEPIFFRRPFLSSSIRILNNCIQQTIILEKSELSIGLLNRRLCSFSAFGEVAIWLSLL